MTGILAQTITLTSYGNEYLENGKLNDFYPQNSSFEHCHSVEFKEINKKYFFSKKNRNSLCRKSNWMVWIIEKRRL